MLPQRIGGLQFGHVGVMASAFALRKRGTGVSGPPSKLEQRIHGRFHLINRGVRERMSPNSSRR